MDVGDDNAGIVPATGIEALPGGAATVGMAVTKATEAMQASAGGADVVVADGWCAPTPAPTARAALAGGGTTLGANIGVGCGISNMWCDSDAGAVGSGADLVGIVGAKTGTAAALAGGATFLGANIGVGCGISNMWCDSDAGAVGSGADLVGIVGAKTGTAAALAGGATFLGASIGVGCGISIGMGCDIGIAGATEEDGNVGIVPARKPCGATTLGMAMGIGGGVKTGGGASSAS
jgi:hypothetical protein